MSSSETKQERLCAIGRTRMSVVLSLMIAIITTMIAVGAHAAPALAVEPGPGWTINVVAQPTNFSPARNAECAKAVSEEGQELKGINSMRCDRYMVTVRNEGTVAIEGDVVVIKDVLPEKLTAVSIAPGQFEEGSESNLTCDLTTVSCTTSEAVPPGGVLTMVVDVEVAAQAADMESDTATVSGGTATAVSVTTPTTVTTAQSAFGVSEFSVHAFGVDGAPDLQAGDRPHAVTTSLQFATVKFPEGEVGPEGTTQPNYLPVEDVKDIVVDLPQGLVGDPEAAPQCPESLLLLRNGGCPKASQVGNLGIEGEGATSPGLENIPIFNLIPEHGYPAEFGFEYLSREFVMYASVTHTAAGYGLRVTVPGLPNWRNNLEIVGILLTFFGDPAAQDGGSSSPAAFFTNPVDCSAGPLRATVEADSWTNPGVFVAKETLTYPRVTGCNMLQFQPTLAVAPEAGTRADEPAGYNIDAQVPQAANVFPALATPELRDATVTFPQGVSVSPSAADGLVGCQETGPEGIDIPSGERAPNEVGEGEALGADGLSHLTPGHCPAGSTLGTVEITTPLLPEPLKGNLFVAQPKCGSAGQPGCTEVDATNGNLFGLYLEAEGSGVVFKLAGTVSASPSTGQLSATFKENPELPFSDLKIQLKGGPRAPLANPQGCGTFTTASALTPWSGGAPAAPSSSFAIGSGCAAGFSPAFNAGTITPTAGAFSPFTLSFSRHDGEQNLSAVTVAMPPGLLGKLSAVQQCPEPQASQGTCGPQSLIGHTTVAAGPGSQPYYVTGNVFLTGPYKGQPFGLSVVVPAVAGPFNLGNVIVRAAIHIDPHTAQITATSDPLPQIIDGVPLRIQKINVTTDRPGFMFNPTNCAQQQVSATIAAAQGAAANVASPFAAAGCASLPFKPSFTVSTQAKTSKANGASLDVKISAPGQGPQTNPAVTPEANIKKVDVQLPLVLPSRLTTLNKACPAAQFESNPAGCPAASAVGTAVAHTPVLPVPLEGPAYLVSHAGAAFPDLVVVLQGDGVVIDLTGNTLIRKGITYSKFETAPDAPISSFELKLPQGRYSVLGANGNLCSHSLLMPTTIVGQNGAQLTQNTKIAVSGCKAVTIYKRRLSAKSVVLAFNLTAKGTVTVTGRGLRRYRKTLGAGSHQIKVALSKNGLSERRHHRKIKIRVALKSGSKTSSATTIVKL